MKRLFLTIITIFSLNTALFGREDRNISAFVVIDEKAKDVLIFPLPLIRIRESRMALNSYIDYDGNSRNHRIVDLLGNTFLSGKED